MCSAWRRFLRSRHRNVAWPASLIKFGTDADPASLTAEAKQAKTAAVVRRLAEGCPRRPLSCSFYVEDDSDEDVLAALTASLPPRCTVVGTSAGGGLSQLEVARPNDDCVTVQLIPEMHDMQATPFRITSLDASKNKEDWTREDLDALFFQTPTGLLASSDAGVRAPGPEDHVALAFFVHGTCCAPATRAAWQPAPRRARTLKNTHTHTHTHTHAHTHTHTRTHTHTHAHTSTPREYMLRIPLSTHRHTHASRARPGRR